MEGAEQFCEGIEYGAAFDIIATLPAEMALYIFRFMRQPNELGIVALVSKVWNRFAYQSTLWKQLCIDRWATKQYISIEDVIRRENEALRQHVEKNEEEASCKRHSVLSKSGSWIDWREKLLLAETDSKREVITKEELCGVKWSFHFQHDMWAGGDDHVFFPSFLPDGTYVHEDVGFRSMNWRFLDVPS